MSYYALLFVAGIAGSFHCIGMCGGFACALGGDPRGRGATALRHALYNTGRLTTYCFLGGLAGGLGWSICVGTRSRAGSSDPQPVTRRRSAGSGRDSGATDDHHGDAVLRLSTASPRHDRFRWLDARQRAARACFARGVTRHRLPSAWSMAFCRARWSMPWSPRPRVALDVLSGCLTMAAFGLGTFPTMLVMGGLGRLLAPRMAAARRPAGGELHFGAGGRHARAGHRSDDGAWLAPSLAFRMTPPARCSVPPLPVAARPAGFCPSGERRELPVLLLWLLHRLSSKKRQRRSVGGGVAPGASRRGKLSVHEHHAVQSVGVFGGIQRVPTGAFFPPFICCFGDSRRRRY